MTVDINTRYVLPSKSNRLVSGEFADGGVHQVAEPVSQPGMISPLSIRTIPAYYDLAQAENRKLIEWLLPLSDEGLATRLLRLLKIRNSAPQHVQKDVRYLLSEALLYPDVQANFDLVIIDAPPRLTTSHIQGMCAATHLLVPTVLDGLAGDAVARYLDQVATHKLGTPEDASRAICPYIQPLGIVCTLLPPAVANLTGPLNVLQSRIEASRLKPDIAPEQCFVRQRAPYRAHAGELIAYAAASNDQQHQILRDEIDCLGDWIAPRLGCVPKGWRRRT